MCTLDEAGRKSICASEREILHVRKKSGIAEAFEVEGANRLVVEGNTSSGRNTSHGNATNYDRRNAFRARWTLEGRLVQPWIAELKSNWARTETARQERKCVVDLTGVTFIDKSGEKALAQLFKEGAELIATGIYTRHVVHTSRGKSRIGSCEGLPVAIA